MEALTTTSPGLPGVELGTGQRHLGEMRTRETPDQAPAATREDSTQACSSANLAATRLLLRRVQMTVLFLADVGLGTHWPTTERTQLPPRFNKALRFGAKRTRLIPG